MAVTKEDAVSAKIGDVFHFTLSSGKMVNLRVSGKCATWKTRPDEFRLPLECGMRESGSITHHNAKHWTKGPKPEEQPTTKRTVMARDPLAANQKALRKKFPKHGTRLTLFSASGYLYLRIEDPDRIVTVAEGQEVALAFGTDMWRLNRVANPRPDTFTYHAGGVVFNWRQL